VSDEAIRDRDRTQQMKWGLNKISWSACLKLVSGLERAYGARLKGNLKTKVTDFLTIQGRRRT
jgi:hypothetical protein